MYKIRRCDVARNEYDDIDDLVKDLENEISKEVALNVAEEMKEMDEFLKQFE